MLLRVMSFNLRTARALDGPNWRSRRQAALELISAAEPDVVGLQEAVGSQVRDIGRALPHYRAVGRGRGRWGCGERAALLIDKGIEVVRVGDFWLSQRPRRPGSVGWDAALPRVCTWALLRRSGAEVAVFNTHFDHRGHEALERSAALIVSRIRELDKPSILTGDLNAQPGSAPLSLLAEAGFRDALAVRHPELAQAPTFHRFGTLERGPRIDYVLCDGSFEVIEARIVHSSPGASDHYPVVCDLRHPV